MAANCLSELYWPILKMYKISRYKNMLFYRRAARLLPERCLKSVASEGRDFEYIIFPCNFLNFA